MDDKIIEFTGEHVKQLRKRLKMTLEEFAAPLGVTRQTISNYETGYRVPSRLRVMQILLVFGDGPYSNYN